MVIKVKHFVRFNLADNVRIYEMPWYMNEDECWRAVREGFKPTVEMHNLVTTVGFNLIRDALRLGDNITLTQVGYGTGTTAALITDTTLESEVAKSNWTSTIIAPASVTFAFLMPSGSNNGTTFTEAGAFTATPTMFNRFIHTAIAKTSAKQIFYQLTISLGEA